LGLSQVEARAESHFMAPCRTRRHRPAPHPASQS
jgi:hypothetical protein